jgi:hypothetical protein
MLGPILALSLSKHGWVEEVRWYIGKGYQHENYRDWMQAMQKSGSCGTVLLSLHNNVQHSRRNHHQN